MSDTHPSWLKSMQNGTIGEARSKAFLLDRFWVLERSVDIDGADFIIQRRLTKRNLLDPNAPKLGIIQVKFFGTANTTHHVHRHYVLNEDGEIRTEFFVLCHVGNEEHAQMYLISGEDLSKFPVGEHDGQGKFRLGFQNACSNAFLVTDKKRALDRIERQLEHADFISNRRFMSWVMSSVRLDASPISPIYQELIDNSYGNLRDTFSSIKKDVQNAAFKVAEVLDRLNDISRESDPLVVEEIIDELSCDHKRGTGEWSIALPRLDDEEFYQACREHKRVFDALKGAYLLEFFLDARKSLIQHLSEYAADRLLSGFPNPVDFELIYNPNDFSDLKICPLEHAYAPVRQAPADDPYAFYRSFQVLTSRPGNIICAWNVSNMPKVLPERTTLLPLLRREVENFVTGECMDEIFKLKFGK